jgi:hypothetical protein
MSERIKQSNGKHIVTRAHTSKRGKTYKRRRIVTAAIEVPTWWYR